jgi:hypothetical protein
MTKLQMLRDGTWVYGPDNTPADPAWSWFLDKSELATTRLELHHAGIAVEWSPRSDGTRQAGRALQRQCRARLYSGDPATTPELQLRSVAYEHPRYGTFSIPRFEVVGWH